MSHRLLVIIVALVLALCVVGVYGSTFSGSYLGDDYFLISVVDNAPQPWTSLTRLVTRVPDGHNPRHYRTLWEASFLLDAKLFGLNAFVSRLFSALLHVGNGTLLFLLYRRLLGDRTSAFLAAVLFTVFPVYLSAVAWVAARGDLLAVFFSLCALNLHARALATGLTLKAKLGIGALVFLGIHSKETGLIAVPALTALHWHFSRTGGGSLRVRLRDLWIGTWWLWAWLAVNLAMRYWVLGTLIGGYRREISPGFGDLAEQAARIATTICFPFSAAGETRAPNVLIAVILGAGLALTYFAFRPAGEKSSRTYRLTIIWLVLTALPLLNLGAMSSRFLYQPAAAWCPLLVILIHRLTRSASRNAARVGVYAALCGGLIGYSLFASQQAIQPYREGGAIGRELFTAARTLLSANDGNPVVLYNVPDSLGPCYIGRNAFPTACLPPFLPPRTEPFVIATDIGVLLPQSEQALVSIALRRDSLYFRWDPEAGEFHAAGPPSLPGTVSGRLTSGQDGSFNLEPASIRIEGEREALAPLVDQFVVLEGRRVGSSQPPVFRVTAAQVTAPMLQLSDAEGKPNSVSLSITGEPGDQVFLGASARRGFFPVGTAGTLLLDQPLPWEMILMPTEGRIEVTLGIPDFDRSGLLLVQAVVRRGEDWLVKDLIAVEID